MSLPLKDFRLTVSENVLAALEARAVAKGHDMQTVARKVLTDWALEEHRAYTLYARRVLANGMQSELPGFETVDDGTRRGRAR